MCTFLQSPSKSSGYYKFRRRVPDDLRPIVGKREWLIPLKTKDRAEAKRLVPDLAKATDEAISEARAKLAAMQSAEVAESAPAGSPAPAWAIPLEQLEADEVLAREAVEQEFRREARAAKVEALARRLKLSTRDMPEDDAAIADLLRGEREARQEAEQRATMADARARVAMPKPDKSAAAEQACSAAPISILGLFDDYSKERGNRRTTDKEWRACISRLVDFLGHDDATRVQRADLVRWKDHLREQVGPKGKPLTAVTINGNYLCAARVTFQRGIDNGSLTSNPATGVKAIGKKAPKLRPSGYTDTEAHAILAAALLPDNSKTSEEYKLAKRWVPWLCAYTGARVGEMAQLRAEDVITIDGVHVLNITPAAGDVKTDVFRHVPIHSHLVAMGFLAVAKARGTGPLFYTLERSKVEGGGDRLHKKVGEKVAQMVRALNLPKPHVDQPNHAWRYRVKSQSADCGIEERMIDALQGHAPVTTGQDYFEPSISAKAAAIEKLPRYIVPGLPSVPKPS